MIRVWALGTWAVLQILEAYQRGTGPFTACLAVRGSKLVSGSAANYGQRELGIWGLEALDLQHTLLQPSGKDVAALLAMVEGCGLAWGWMLWCGGAGRDRDAGVARRFSGWGWQ